ncbi:MAG: hypothetical protein JXA30_02360 [Deltaproteobacteria bacterium]|nr:hypothetical protein [Deltaproteobacteria bacterium]
MKVYYQKLVIAAACLLCTDIAAAQDSNQSAETASESAETGDDSAKPISIGLLLSGGIDFEDNGFDQFGPGIGLRGGYTLDMGLYIGAQFLYIWGAGGGIPTSTTLIGAEAGYALSAGPVVIMPSAMLGAAIFSIDTDSTGWGSSISGDSSTDFYAAPGASVIYPIKSFFIGGDARFYLIFAEKTVKGLNFMLTGGMRF